MRGGRAAGAEGPLTALQTPDAPGGGGALHHQVAPCPAPLAALSASRALTLSSPFLAGARSGYTSLRCSAGPLGWGNPGHG